MFSTRFPFVLLVTVVLSLGIKLTDALNFTFGESGDPFKCNPSGNIYCGGDATSTAGFLSLTPLYDPSNTAAFYSNTYGTALTAVPLVLLDSTNRWDSFKTSFQFLINPSEDGSGDGMTFVMLNVSQYPGNSGGNFGLYDDFGQAIVATLAVEFDTFQNDGDANGNHVGLDLENRTSVVARNASEVGVELLGQRVYSWIDYDSSSENLEVRINITNSRPVESFLQYKVNLFDVFHQNRLVYVGFTASNGNCTCHNFYSIYDWKFEHFPAFAQPFASPRKGNNQTGFIAGATVGALVLIIVLGLFLFQWRKRRNGGDSKLEKTAELAGISDNLRYSYKQLSLATGQFREESKLGQGGFGSVYRGVIPSTGVPVAVKKVSHDSKQGLKEFVAEVSIISQLRHRNIVRLLGWCDDNNQFLLVYEFMPNGSLDKALFHQAPGCPLSWKHRFQIIVGAAEALHYLHEGWRQQIIHRDFKSSNIMLDENFNAMLGDFGLARMVDRQEDPATTMVAGTFGYIAPEAPVTGKFTEKTDVYAFGAVALEVACGRTAYSYQLPEEERVLVDWVWKKLDEGNLLSAADPRLEGRYDSQQVQVLLLLGLLCSHPNPTDRPSMRQVLEVLAGDVAMPPVPLSKPAPEYNCSGREFRMEALKLISATDTISEAYTHELDRSIHRTARPSDPLIVFSKSSAESTVSAHASDPLIKM